MSATTDEIYITATSLDPDTGKTQTGWIDPTWSMTQLRDDKEDVSPLEVDIAEDISFIEDLIFRTIGDCEIEDTPTGERWYSVEVYQDPTTGLYWNYCAHVTR